MFIWFLAFLFTSSVCDTWVKMLAKTTNKYDRMANPFEAVLACACWAWIITH